MSAIGNIKIALYEPWMRDQIVQMICREYGFREEDEDRLIKNFYEHPYQREKSIRITALDGEKVVGFQSFFHWPYLLDGKPVNTYQSGNSIVDPDYRGRGIFSRLLMYLNEIREDKQIDFLMGFPVGGSYNSFIRNKWSNVLNLNWYMKVINPFSIVRKLDFAKLSLEDTPEYMLGIPAWKGFTLNCGPEFETWRKAYSKSNNYFYFHYDDGSYRVQFDLKVNLRGRLKELIVGRVRTDCDNLDFLKKAVKGLVKKVRRQHAFTFISVALNRRYFKPEILMAFCQLGFKRINKEISFIVKDYRVGERVYKPELWELYRSDIDTW
jgi:GNAT superfamily N-acetyltransferase